LTFFGNFLRLTGTLIPFSGTHTPLYVDIIFVKTTPPASPHIELQPSAYTIGGIDPSTWSFYSFTSHAFVEYAPGLYLNITQQPGATPFQVGVGANGKNLRFGGSGWFDWHTSDGQVGSGDINIDLFCPNSTTNSTTNSTVPPPPPPSNSGCNVSITLTETAHWTQNGQNFTQWSAELTNTGSLNLVDVLISFSFPPSANCAGSVGGCSLNDYWAITPVSNSNNFHLFSYETENFTPGSNVDFGFIVVGDTVVVSVDPSCSVTQ